MSRERSWNDILTPRDRIVFDSAGYGKAMELGARPALVIVDVTYDFTGGTPEPILDSIDTWPNSAGEEAWVAVDRISDLLQKARSLHVPVFFTRSKSRGPNSPPMGRWADKNSRTSEWRGGTNGGSEIVAPIRPRDDEPVFEKIAPSGFFATDLLSSLIDIGADTLVVCGGTTSGCVRATVVDAFSYNFRTVVVEDAVFDRGQTAHKASLFDIHLKYGEVISTRDALDYLDRVGIRTEAGAS